MQDVIASSDNRVVVGLGVTGLSCARFLHSRGLAFSVADTQPSPPKLAQLRRELPSVQVYAGDIPAGLLADASEIIVSPGVALDDPALAEAIAAGVTIIGDIDLFMREAQAPVVGITGSNAKSTVTELLGLMAAAAGLDVGVGGNLGTPALELLAPERQLYVLELSSFQLERAGTLGLAVATVLNVSPDHLDRHGNMQRYHQAKHRIFRGCHKAVVNRDDPLTLPLVAADVEQLSWRLGIPELGGFGLRHIDGEEFICHGFDALLPVTAVPMAGRHNVANVLAALALGHAAGLPMAAMVTSLQQFSGLPHRCQWVAEIEGVRYLDDSKGTNVGATQAALTGVGGDQNILLIAGGEGKGADFRQLRSAVARHCRALLLIGRDAPKLEQALADLVPCHRCESMTQAVTMAADIARPGDSVLLSPACASFDMFTGYAQRGDAFVAAVAALSRGADA